MDKKGHRHLDNSGILTRPGRLANKLLDDTLQGRPRTVQVRGDPTYTVVTRPGIESGHLSKASQTHCRDIGLFRLRDMGGVSFFRAIRLRFIWCLHQSRQNPTDFRPYSPILTVDQKCRTP
ncbi:hypothetical protein RRG08_003821 [Elysia crispata]|uniref:Uncharacterized protein n=1 Tax=Elysia crispata TaxID=231223 RepID=A0AAE0ZDR8_9GAST|nr:hypothetical protein RRG08_003821 [Elysia crispata]